MRPCWLVGASAFRGRGPMAWRSDTTHISSYPGRARPGVGNNKSQFLFPTVSHRSPELIKVEGIPQVVERPPRSKDAHECQPKLAFRPQTMQVQRISAIEKTGLCLIAILIQRFHTISCLANSHLAQVIFKTGASKLKRIHKS